MSYDTTLYVNVRLNFANIETLGYLVCLLRTLTVLRKIATCSARDEFAFSFLATCKPISVLSLKRVDANNKKIHSFNLLIHLENYSYNIVYSI